MLLPVPPTIKLTAEGRPKRRWQRVDGVVLLDKPSGMTSNAALQAARRLYCAAKAGHTGTLDPLATGLLPLCFGEATKFSADLLDAAKTYEADVLFGVTTDTGDAQGEVLDRRLPDFSLADLEKTIISFRGEIRQVPPMYSALKRNGRPLYELARQGLQVEREARQVTIHALTLSDFSGDRCRLRVTCSKGTYIRTLAEDIGRALSCGAHLTALRRTAVGDLSIAAAVSLDILANADETTRGRYVLPTDALLQNFAPITLDESDAARFSHGNPVAVPIAAPGKRRVYREGRLLGVGELDATGFLRPRRLVGN